jgi:flagellar hook protein FlgE
MASTTALYTGLSGLNVNSRYLEVIGNNIANSNTTAFKSSRMLFQNQITRVLNMGTAPDSNFGGTNPTEVGLGVGVAATQINMNSGSITATGVSGDLAIDGAGFFVIDRGGQQFYTRAGSFSQNANNDLVTAEGDRVLGFGVDNNFNIIPGQLVDLNIPVGTMKVAQATQNVAFTGNLNAGGSAATQGSAFHLGSSDTAGFVLLPTAPPPNPGDAIEATSLLTDMASPASPTTPLFTVGQTFEVSGAEKGGAAIANSTYKITATSTVQDLMNFISNALALDPSAGPNPDGKTPGVTLDPVSGNLNIVGNIGTASDLALDSTDLKLLDSAGALVGSPIVPTKDGAATGESARTTAVVYDSLGTPITMNVTMVLQSKGTGGTTWRYFVDSPFETNTSPVVGTGTVDFDTAGKLQNTQPLKVSIDRAGTGANTPLSMNLVLSNGSDALTALTSDTSTIASTFQDGSPLGVLSGFGVGANGVIVGSFSNGLTRPLGQVALAGFANPQGLIQSGSNLFLAGANSGTAVITQPGSFGTGSIVGGSLEGSNVDLGQEFINMIQASTGYSASSRVIKTTDDLLQQLLVLGR